MSSSESFSDSVCFTRQDFNTYTYLLLMVLIFVIYVLYQSSSSRRESLSDSQSFGNVNTMSHITSQKELQSKIQQLQEQLYTFQLAEQRCKTELIRARSELGSQPSVNSLVQKIYNPLVPPERRYEGGNVRVSGYQMIGYIYNGNDRYPLFGKYKFPGRTEKWEYYIIDETRNKLKIPFKSVNDNEITDGDTVNIPTLGDGFTAKIYEYEQFRYNPNVL